MNIPKDKFKAKPKDWKSKHRKSVLERELYSYGCPVLFEKYEQTQRKLRQYEEEGADRHIDRNFMQYQYDLDVELFLNYEDYRSYFEGYIPREEFFWNAAAQRWPTRITPTGKSKGVMVRTPWSERIIWAFANNTNVALVGGAGIGKTLTPLALYLMAWDHYIETPEGARVSFTSTSEKKLLAASWSNLTTLQSATQQNISKYAGLANVMASIKFTKPRMSGITEEGHDRSLFSKDHKAVMVGQQLGGTDINPAKAAEQVDKLTGSHVKELAAFLLDEFQSMGSVGPLSAVKNLQTHVRNSWVCCSGNLSLPDDPLGLLCEPVGGYSAIDVVNEEDWIGRDPRGMEWYVCHFNNDHSPGMRDPKKYWFMPTRRKRDERYKASERDGIEYARFWLGDFQPEAQSPSIISEDLLKFTQADQIADFNKNHRITTFFTFDSAPANLDRSVAMECQIGRLNESDVWCLNFVAPHFMRKTARATYLRDTGAEFAALMKSRKVASGDVILDDTGTTGMQEELMQRHQMMSRGVKYNAMPSNEKIDYATNKTAKEQCLNTRAEMALLLQRFIENGMIRGLHPKFCENLRKEICAIRWKEGASRDRKQVEDKKEFKGRLGFSPDIFDCCMMAALHARDFHGLVPGYSSQSHVHHREESNDYLDAAHSIYSDTPY